MWRDAMRSAGSSGARNVTRRSHASWTIRSIKEHVSNKRRYNGPDWTARGASGPSDHESKDVILSVFKRLSMDQIVAVHHDLMATTYLKRSTMDRSIVTVDRNDQTVTPKNDIKRSVLRPL